MTSAGRETLNVLIATPLGPNGKGGIDRLTDRTLEVIAQRANTCVAARHLVTRGPGSILLSPFYFVRAILQLWGASRTGRVDLLHIQLSVKGSAARKVLLAAWARSLGIPYIVHLHGPDFGVYWSSASAPVASGLDALFEGSEAIIVMGKVWADVISQRLPGVRDKITILPNATASGVATARQLDQDTRTHIVFLGEVGPRKGAPQLIDALSLLRARTDWRATMAGNGNLEVSLAQARASGVDDRIMLPGWLETGAAARLLAQADIFVLPSFAENQPLSVLEAFAAGAAVIATPVGAVPDVVDHGRNGLLTPVGDVRALADSIETLLDNPDLRRSMGANARGDHTQRYTMQVHVDRLLEIWRNSLTAGNERQGRLRHQSLSLKSSV